MTTLQRYNLMEGCYKLSKRKPHTSLYHDEGLMDKVKLLLIQTKKWKSANEFIIEAIKEKLEREESHD